MQLSLKKLESSTCYCSIWRQCKTATASWNFIQCCRRTRECLKYERISDHRNQTWRIIQDLFLGWKLAESRERGPYNFYEISIKEFLSKCCKATLKYQQRTSWETKFRASLECNKCIQQKSRVTGQRFQPKP